MKRLAVSLLFVVCCSAVRAQTAIPTPDVASDFVRVSGDAKAGFVYPYYLYIPPDLKQEWAKKVQLTLLVLPNNTGAGPSDDFAVHEDDVKRRMPGAAAIAASLKVGVLMPVFPRPRVDWRIYTLALDRDSMVTDKKEYRRLDLQLIKMIDDARERLRKEHGLRFDKRVLLNGFSAQGMFANRFTFLHPERVKAAAIGSPGGWPIAPVATFRDKKLRYPIGVGDIKTVSGKKLDIERLKKVPLFVFIGDKDTNDSVPFGDSYDDEDRDLINSLFGKTPVERWPIAEALYKQAGLNAIFRTYPDVAHAVTPIMREDIRSFLFKHR